MSEDESSNSPSWLIVEKQNPPSSTSRISTAEPDWLTPAWVAPPPSLPPAAPLVSATTSKAVRHSTCDKCTGFFVFFGYAAINLVDMILSGCLLMFSIYFVGRIGPISSLPVYVSWIIYTDAILGSLILVEVLLSLSALIFVNCRSASHVSQNMTYVLAAASFITGIMAFILETIIFNYLSNHSKDYDLTHHDLDAMKTYYKAAAAIALGAVPPFQGIRFCLSSSFDSTSQQLDGEFDSALQEHDRLLGENQVLIKESRTEKYQSLRNHYQNKY